MANSDALNRSVLSQYYELQVRLSDHAAAIRNESFDTAQLLRQVEAIQRNLKDIGNFLSCTVPNKFYHERRTATSETAARVFHIPELLELILEHCTTFDLIEMRKTCTGIKATIEASPKLQGKLFLRPEGALVDLLDEESWLQGIQAHPKSRLLNNPLDPSAWFEVHHDYAGGRHVTITFTPDQSGKQLPHVGDLWKRMLICQPPITTVDVVRECAKHHRFCQLESYPRDPSDERPLTFGDLYDEANMVFGSRGAYGVYRTRGCDHQEAGWKWAGFQYHMPIPWSDLDQEGDEDSQDE